MKVVIPFAVYNDNNPNMPGLNYDEALNTYYKCMCVAFASIKINNPTLSLQLTTNTLPPVKYCEILTKIGVSIRITPFTFLPDFLRLKKYRTSFYLFDAISNENTNNLYLDPDIICVSPIELTKSEEKCVGGLIMEFDENSDVNGISPRSASLIYADFEKTALSNHSHLGGEILYVPGAKHQELNNKIRALWAYNNKLAENGKNYLTTEEHFLSCLFSTENFFNLNHIALRIWTTRLSKFSEGGKFNPLELPIWHLPGEKFRAFQMIFEQFDLDNWELNVNSKNFHQSCMRLVKYSYPKGTQLVSHVLRTFKNKF